MKTTQRLRKQQMMERKHEMSYCITKTHYMHCGKKGLSHYSAPLSHGLTLVLSSLLKSSIINWRDQRRACEGIVLFDRAAESRCLPSCAYFCES